MSRNRVFLSSFLNAPRLIETTINTAPMEADTFHEYVHSFRRLRAAMSARVRL
jgi:hypothetical protein